MVKEMLVYLSGTFFVKNLPSRFFLVNKFDYFIWLMEPNFDFIVSKLR